MMNISKAILRAVPGAFILNSGLNKLKADEGKAQWLHGEAVKGLPFLKNIDPKTFTKFLSYGEITLASTLLAPFVSARVAGAGLSVFAAGLLSSYFGNPDNTEKDGIRPSGQGTILAKDSWLAAIGLALITAPVAARVKRVKK